MPKNAWPDPENDIQHLREIAREGELANTARKATGDERRRLTGATYLLAYPVVFYRWTRALEQKRRHWACATSVNRMADGCLDRFYDDTEAVMADVLVHATVPINNLEGWIVPRLGPATVDAHRRRRGARGALRRPRLPACLINGLPDDPWLGRLAIEILTWVGVPATSGSSLWPLDSWTDRRALTTRDWTTSDPLTVGREVEHVLRVMRSRPQWYAKYVELPLGGKTPPTVSALVESNSAVESAGLALVEPHEQADLRLLDLADEVLTAIEVRLAAGQDPYEVVTSVIRTAFADLAGRPDLGGVPSSGPDLDEQVIALLDNPAELRRIVATIMDIVCQRAGRRD